MPSTVAEGPRGCRAGAARVPRGRIRTRGRFTQQRPSAELAALFAAEDLAESPGERYNLAPQQLGLVVVEREKLQRAIVPYRWGLVPSWAKDAKIGNRLINARAETVASTPAFWPSFANGAASSRPTASTSGSA